LNSNIAAAPLRADGTDFVATSLPPPDGLQFVRASGLAQARLQLAILSGDRRRALCEIDRLVEIDRQLAHLVEHGRPVSEHEFSGEPIDAHLARQRRAIATEKLALGAAMEFPRLPSLRESEELLLGEANEITAIEDKAFPRRLVLAAVWLVALIALGAALAIGIPMLV
jgi:hypothetical protein